MHFSAVYGDGAVLFLVFVPESDGSGSAFGSWKNGTSSVPGSLCDSSSAAMKLC